MSSAFARSAVNINVHRSADQRRLSQCRSSFHSPPFSVGRSQNRTQPARLFRLGIFALADAKKPDGGNSEQHQEAEIESTIPSASTDYLSKLNKATEKRKQSPPVSAQEIGSKTISILGEALSGDEGGAAAEKEKQAIEKREKVIVLKSASKSLWRLSWLCWWPQLILTVISSIIILFSLLFPSINISTTASTIGFILTSASIIFSFISLIYTYSYTRLSLYLSTNKNDKSLEQLSSHIITRLTYGLAITLIGLLISTLGLQSIVGTILTKLLTSGLVGKSNISQYPNAIPSNVVVPANSLANIVQPIDILVVQACTNVILSLLFAIICTSWFMLRVKHWEKKAVQQQSS